MEPLQHPSSPPGSAPWWLWRHEASSTKLSSRSYPATITSRCLCKWLPQILKLLLHRKKVNRADAGRSIFSHLRCTISSTNRIVRHCNHRVFQWNNGSIILLLYCRKDTERVTAFDLPGRGHTSARRLMLQRFNVMTTQVLTERSIWPPCKRKRYFSGSASPHENYCGSCLCSLPGSCNQPRTDVLYNFGLGKRIHRALDLPRSSLIAVLTTRSCSRIRFIVIVYDCPGFLLLPGVCHLAKPRGCPIGGRHDVN